MSSSTAVMFSAISQLRAQHTSTAVILCYLHALSFQSQRFEVGRLCTQDLRRRTEITPVKDSQREEVHGGGIISYQVNALRGNDLL